MSENNLGKMIAKKRKELGYTQQVLAEKLNVSFQAVSKWETGSSSPEIHMLPTIAAILGTSVDALLGYKTMVNSDYEQKYLEEGYYWGLTPNYLCHDLMQKRPPVKPLRVLDMGCGEGKDAVFLAKNGYLVTAFDVSEAGLDKGRKLAEKNGTYVDFFKADINDFELKGQYDIIFCSGVFHYIHTDKREEVIEKIKSHLSPGGMVVLNVFVDKPHVKKTKNTENAILWKSGELFTFFYDWKFLTMEEFTFDCNSGGNPHQHCMDVLIAER